MLPLAESGSATGSPHLIERYDHGAFLAPSLFARVVSTIRRGDRGQCCFEANTPGRALSRLCDGQRRLRDCDAYVTDNCSQCPGPPKLCLPLTQCLSRLANQRRCTQAPEIATGARARRDASGWIDEAVDSEADSSPCCVRNNLTSTTVP